MCDDIQVTVADLAVEGVTAGPITDRGYGLATSIWLPSGAEIGLYEPRHEIALDL